MYQVAALLRQLTVNIHLGSSIKILVETLPLIRVANSKPLSWKSLYIDNSEAPVAPASGGFHEDRSLSERSLCYDWRMGRRLKNPPAKFSHLAMTAAGLFLFYQSPATLPSAGSGRPGKYVLARVGFWVKLVHEERLVEILEVVELQLSRQRNFDLVLDVVDERRLARRVEHLHFDRAVAGRDRVDEYRRHHLGRNKFFIRVLSQDRFGRTLKPRQLQSFLIDMIHEG